MSEAIEATAEVTSTAVVPAQQAGLVRMAAPITEVIAAQQEYQEVCRKLLDHDTDIQVIGSKEFKKRSAWNKLAVAFGVSTTEVRTTHERDERGRIIRTECLVRATAQNGRASDGLGACDLYERCCDPETCTKLEFWQDSGRPTGHKHCASPCKTAHFSNPQHDIPATAFTRASNRAKADLFGMGEVSAEEVEGGHSGGGWTPSDTASQSAQGAPAGRQSGNGGQSTAGITDGQRKAIYAICKGKGMDNPRDHVAIAARVTGRDDLTDTTQLTKAEASRVIDALNADEAA